MSHEANLYCKTCDKIDEETDFKYYNIDLINLLKIYMRMLEIYKPILKNNFYGFQIGCYPQLTDFLNQHWNHEIVVRSECYPHYLDIPLRMED